MDNLSGKGSLVEKNNQRGLTIIELMVTLILTSFILGGLSFFFIDYMEGWEVRFSNLELQRQGMFALSAMEKSIRASHDVVIDTTPTKITVSVTEPDEDEAFTIEYHESEGRILDSNGRILIPDGDVEDLSVESLLFTEEPGFGRSVRIDLKVVDKYEQRVSFTTTVRLRNELSRR